MKMNTSSTTETIFLIIYWDVYCSTYYSFNTQLESTTTISRDVNDQIYEW